MFLFVVLWLGAYALTAPTVEGWGFMEPQDQAEMAAGAAVVEATLSGKCYPEIVIVICTGANVSCDSFPSQYSNSRPWLPCKWDVPERYSVGHKCAG